MRGNTKAQCAQFEKAITAIFTAAFGPGVETDTGGLGWSFQREEGTVHLTLSLDSLEKGHGYRSRNVFCRLDAPGDVNPWGSNGKNNMHVDDEWDHTLAVNNTLWHVTGMMQRGNPARRVILSNLISQKGSA